MVSATATRWDPPGDASPTLSIRRPSGKGPEAFEVGLMALRRPTLSS